MVSSTFRCPKTEKIARDKEVKSFLSKTSEIQFSHMIDNLGFYHSEQSNTKNFVQLTQSMGKNRMFFRLIDNFKSELIMVPISMTKLGKVVHPKTDFILFLLKDKRKLEKASRKTGGKKQVLDDEEIAAQQLKNQKLESRKKVIDLNKSRV